MPKVEIHLEITVPSEPLDVNQVIALFQEIQARIGPAMVASYLEARQDTALDEVLGPKRADQPDSHLGFVLGAGRSRDSIGVVAVLGHCARAVWAACR